ncbi:hypothetical protein PMAYCL1PPCAC_02619, partial [Pristionchus mayeri]
GRVLAAPSLEGPQIDLRSSVVNNTKQATHSSSKMHPRRASPSPLRKASRTSSSLSLMSANDVSEMMFPPFLTNDPHGSKPELIEHSFRLQRLSDRSSLYNLKIKWYENQPTKAEFSHELKMSLKDIHKSHSTRSSSMPVKSSRVPKPEPEYISIHGADVEAEKSCKVESFLWLIFDLSLFQVVARAIAQVRRDGNIVRMLFRSVPLPSLSTPSPFPFFAHSPLAVTITLPTRLSVTSSTRLSASSTPRAQLPMSTCCPITTFWPTRIRPSDSILCPSGD